MSYIPFAETRDVTICILLIGVIKVADTEAMMNVEILQFNIVVKPCTLVCKGVLGADNTCTHEYG